MGTPLSRSPGESERSAESLRGPGFGRASRDIDELLSEIFLGSLGLGPHIYVYVYVSFVCKCEKGGGISTMHMYIIHTIRPTKAIPTSAIIMKQIIKKKKKQDPQVYSYPVHDHPLPPRQTVPGWFPC